MKKIRLMAILMLLVIPFVGVKAETAFNSYKAGDLVNFYSTDDEYKAGQEGSEDVGLFTLALEDSSESSQYLRSLAFQVTYGAAFDTNKLDNTNSAYRLALQYLNTEGVTSPYVKNPSESGNLDFIKLEELIDVFGATYDQASESYSIDVDKWGTTFIKLADLIAAQKIAYELTGNSTLAEFGFYTGTVTEDGNYVWVVVFESDLSPANTENYKITGMKVVKQLITDVPNIIYAEVPVLYFDKTYDCHAKKEVVKTYACYKCNETEYSWLENGTQAETCSLVEGAASQADCVKPVKTGIEDYALYVIAIIAIGTLGLIVIKRKALFQNM